MKAKKATLYRDLIRGDVIKGTDEYRAFENWEKVSEGDKDVPWKERCAGKIYRPGFHWPMRRVKGKP